MSEQIFTLLFDCSIEIFFNELIYSKEFILSIIFSFLICFISCIIGIKYAKTLVNQTVENTLKKNSIFIIFRTAILILISFLLIKFNLVFTNFFLVLLFFFYFTFKIIEIIKINSFTKNKNL